MSQERPRKVVPCGTRVVHRRSGQRGTVYDRWHDVYANNALRYSVRWDDGTMVLGIARTGFRLERLGDAT